MSDVHESAKLLLQLYDLRREPKLRAARDWVGNFTPKSVQDIEKIAYTDEGANLWMVLGYWEMACALVNRGAIDRQLFNETTSEHMFIFAVLQPFLADMRKFAPGTLAQTEKLVMSLPNAEKQMEDMRKMMADMPRDKAEA